MTIDIGVRMNLEQMEKIADEATQGPWAWVYCHPGYILQNDADQNVLDGKVSDDFNDANVVGEPGDLAFIREFDPPTVKKLLAVVRAAEGIRHWKDDYDNNPLLAAIDKALAALESE